MNKTISFQKKYNLLTKSVKITIIPVLVIFIALVSSLIWFYNNLTPQNLGPMWLSAFVALSIIILGVFHIIILSTLWISSRIAKTPSIFRSVAIALGCISIVSLAINAVALSDIGNQITSGLDSSNEWTILLINNIIQFLFLLFSYFSLPLFKEKNVSPFILNDDILFITINEVGVFSSIAAICAIVFGLLYSAFQVYREVIIVTYTIIALAPWGLMIIGWFLSRKKTISSWWDEKQVKDMGHSALFSLIIIIFVVMILYIANQLIPSFNADIIWFPSIVVTAILSFSAFNTAFSRCG